MNYFDKVWAAFYAIWSHCHGPWLDFLNQFRCTRRRTRRRRVTSRHCNRRRTWARTRWRIRKRSKLDLLPNCGIWLILSVGFFALYAGNPKRDDTILCDSKRVQFSNFIESRRMLFTHFSGLSDSMRFCGLDSQQTDSDSKIKDRLVWSRQKIPWLS